MSENEGKRTKPSQEETLRSGSLKSRQIPTTGAAGPSLFPSAGAEGLKERLAEIGVFGGLSDDARAFFVDNCQFVKLAIGEVAFREGEPGREMYVLLSGELEVLKRSRRGRDTRVAILGPSDCFGEMSVIDLQPRSATLRALAPTKLLRISAEELDLLYRTDVKAYAMLVLNIARDLSRRLRVADGLVAQVTATMLDEYSKARA
ncbi:MAG: cyclic nucleotide-binding domain-containing protein [Polyangiaceae bacterium]